MPVDFPNLNSLRMAARVHKFRDIKDSETEDEYRETLADHVASIDFIESQEIRTKVGWDRWSDKQKKDMLQKEGLNVRWMGWSK